MARLKAAVFAGLLLAFASAAGAQVAAPGGGVNSPGSAPVVDRERADRLEPSIAPAPAAAPAPPPEVDVAAGGDKAAAITLTRALYMGASLPAATLDAAVAPFVGRPLTRETLQGVANAVGVAYARSDIAFYAVSIPAQIPAGGQLILRVVEGRVKDYRLAGISPSLPTRLIQAHM
ncbi:MAG TPA: POTRA domain-containing protein, partial [Sphingobium sp.]|nr:POTRA domain-containing protein [Sphingobium sp.]